MLQTAKIKIRNLKELQEGYVDLAENNLTAKTPLRKRKKPTASASTTKKLALQNDDKSVVNDKPLNNDVVPATTIKNKFAKSALKEPPPSQKRIDSYFQTCQKNYKIEPMLEPIEPTPIGKIYRRKQSSTRKGVDKSKNKCTTTKKTAAKSKQKRPKAGRKRLFIEPESTTETETTCSYESNKKTKTIIKPMEIDCITIPSDSEGDENCNLKEVENNDDLVITTPSQLLDNILLTTPQNSNQEETTARNISATSSKKNSSSSANNSLKHKKQIITRNKSTIKETPKETISTPSNYRKSARNKSTTSSTGNNENISKPSSSPATKDSSKKTSINNRKSPRNKSTPTSLDNNKTSNKTSSSTTPSTSSFGQNMTDTSKATSKLPLQSSSSTTSAKTLPKRKPKPCPPYKIIEGSTFAVDAFQFGYIENVTQYFLTHFHADHYIGLTKKFSMPLYMSPITARFVREFISIDEKYIRELELNVPQTIDNIEITALDANHCPGAVQFVFKFDTGKCILHTGDFRAWHNMESEPIFWNNDIHTIYLDTTYISDKYAFCTQYESINKAKHLIEEFQEKHRGKRILFICGSYVIGKEKFWSTLAEDYQMKVWAEGNRYKALKAMQDERLNKLLIEDPYEANMHVIAMVKLSYLHLVEYFSEYEHNYDVVFAIRPSGWEKDSKPQYRGKINIIGVEYSEHSSYAEMQRFVKFLKPQHVISTVPTNGRDLMKTAKIPQKWYKYDTLKSSSNYQPTIDTFLGQTPQRKKIRPPNMNKGGFENFVSPISLAKKKQTREINNNNNNNNNNNDEDKDKEMEQVISIYSSENEIAEIKSEPIIENEIDQNAETTTVTEQNDNNYEQELPTIKLEPLIETVNKSEIITVKKFANLNGRKRLERTKPTKSLNLTNIVENENEDCSIIISNPPQPPSLANTSEEFDMPEILNTQNKTNRNKQKLLDKKPKSNLKTIQESGNENASIVISKPPSLINSSEYFETPEIVATQKKIKQKSIEKQPKSNLKITQENSGAIEKNKIKKKLQFKETKHTLNKLAENTPSTSKAAKLKYQKQNSKTTTTSEDDFETIPLSQRTKIIISRSNSQKKPQKTSKSTTTTSGEETERIPLTQRKRRKKESLTNKSINSTDKEQEQEILDQQFEDALSKLSKQTGLTISKIGETPTISKVKTQSSINKPQINPIFKSTTTSNCSKSTDEIPASQTTEQLEYIPRLMRNKITALTQPAYTPTPIKKCKDPPQTSKDVKPFNAKTFLNEILENNQDLDFYNPSQMSTIVEETLSKQQQDKSNDHIPIDLLTDSDATSTKSRLNLIYKSTTSSNCSTSVEEIPASQNTQKLQEYSPRPLRDKINDLTQPTYTATIINKSNEPQTSKVEKPITTTRNKNEIPASQTKQQLQRQEYRPRPLKNNKNAITQPTYTATIIKKYNDPPNSKFNNSTLTTCSTQQLERQEYHPRPLSNKRNSLTQPVYTATPIKKSKDQHSSKDQQQVNSSTPFNSQKVLNNILENNRDIDFYNSSQMATIVEETLSKQCLDNSTDHIPSDLLSDPDADDDWM